MLRDIQNKIIQEALTPLYDFVPAGHNDMDNTNEWRTNPPQMDEYACTLILSDNSMVYCIILQFDTDFRRGYFTRDGVFADIFDLNGKPNRFFDKFRKKIEEKYDQPLKDVPDSKKRFKEYLEMVHLA